MLRTWCVEYALKMLASPPEQQICAVRAGNQRYRSSPLEGLLDQVPRRFDRKVRLFALRATTQYLVHFSSHQVVYWELNTPAQTGQDEHSDLRKADLTSSATGEMREVG
ncbi:hypothetical protein OKW41_001663 [Paraburkholderia sp. UCT70]